MLLWAEALPAAERERLIGAARELAEVYERLKIAG
jgi:hypothetical protein